MKKFETLGPPLIAATLAATDLSAIDLSDDANYQLKKSENLAHLEIRGDSKKEKSQRIIYSLSDLFKKYIETAANCNNKLIQFTCKDQAAAYEEAANYLIKNHPNEFPLDINLPKDISKQVTSVIACSPIKKTLVETSDGKNWTALTEETKKKYLLHNLETAEKSCNKYTKDFK